MLENVTRKFNARQFFMIAILIFITIAEILMDFVTTGFDASIFRSTAYWIELALTILSVVLVTLSVRDFFRERELSSNADIKEAQGKIKKVHGELISRDLMTRFECYVDNINNERKLKAYLDYLRRKKFKANKAKHKDYWQSRIETATNDIEFFKTIGRSIKVSAFAWVKYIPVKTSTVFARVDEGNNDDDDLSGNEPAQVGKLISRKLFMILAISFAFSTLFFTGGDIGLGLIASTFMKLFRIAASAFTGAMDGTHFVKDTLVNKMNRRIDFVQKFLESNRGTRQEAAKENTEEAAA